jgi:hypothetical protein
MARREKLPVEIESKSESAPEVPSETPPRESVWVFLEKLLVMPEIRTFFLYGPPGFGKTYAAYHFGRSRGDVYAVTLTPRRPRPSCAACGLPRGNEFVWHDGPFTAAMREGARLVINEVSHASDDALSILYPVLESERTARLTLPTRRRVRPQPGFQVLCTGQHGAASRCRPHCAIASTAPSRSTSRTPTHSRCSTSRCAGPALQSAKLEPERAIGLRAWLYDHEASRGTRPFGRGVARCSPRARRTGVCERGGACPRASWRSEPRDAGG